MTDMTRHTGAPSGRRLRTWHIILMVAGGLAILGGGLYAILSAVLGPMVESGDDFMRGLRDGRFDRAYALATPALRRELGGVAGLRRSIGAYRPAGWSWSHRSVRNGIGWLEGGVSYDGGRSGRARIRLLQVDGQWRVEAYSLD